MSVYLYNTRTRSKDEFKPLNPPLVTMYCCGPTVYNYAHIGNLRTYIFEDLLVNTLKLAGYKVKHVMNVTDVGHLTSDGDEGEDKMQVAAEREKKSVLEIARMYEDAFFRHTAELGLARPTVVCRGSAIIGASRRASCQPVSQSATASGWSVPVSRAIFLSAGTAMPSARSVGMPKRLMPLRCSGEAAARRMAIRSSARFIVVVSVRSPLLRRLHVFRPGTRFPEKA